MRTLNLGILAHVDAGKTTLSERLLYAAGVIDELGSVDDGNTQTDSLALEQQRGITIKSAVVSFRVGDVAVNLIDTPGHPDFIAEVERVLDVLDGAVLVLSAVEGVQPQTRVLMRTLQRLRLPTVLFVNKIDRGGAQPERVVQEIAAKLTPAVIPLGSVRHAGTRHGEYRPCEPSDPAFVARLTEVLADQDDDLLAAYVGGQRDLRYARLERTLAAQTRAAAVHPIVFGSALTGAGVDALVAAVTQLLPAEEGEVDGPASGTVFKIDRGPAGERIAYVRLFCGTVRVRDRLGDHRKVTAIRVFDRGAAVESGSLRAREIGQLWGLGDVRIGDSIGTPRDSSRLRHHFAPPTLETVVVPRRAEDGGALRIALDQLAEQDPLIDVRQDDVCHELMVSLYGEVQKEVFQATLAADFGLDVDFRDSTTICIERVLARGDALEVLQSEAHPYSATIGLRIEPAAPDSGVQFQLDADQRLLPLHIYKTRDRFVEAMTQYVTHTLREGLLGWPVRDCMVTMTACGYYVGDGPAKPVSATPRTTARHFRKLTPLVLKRALEGAGTVVCEPMARVTIDTPADTLGRVVAVASRLGGEVGAPSVRDDRSAVEVLLPVARVQELRRHLPPLTGGEAFAETAFGGYAPVRGERRR